MSIGDIRSVEFLWDLKKPIIRTKSDRDVVVRRAKLYDVKGIEGMIVEAYLPEWYWWVKRAGGKARARADFMSYVKDFLRNPQKRIFVSQVKNRIVGLVGAAKYHSKTGTIGFGVAVLPAFRRKGIGHALLNTALYWLKGQKVRFVTLEEETFTQRKKSAPAVAFYRKFGGIVIGVR